ncbi:MAG: CoA pyrophosphatase [Ignavibacteriae bacterium]|nr:CoA pyrophosphatase [Ignavibacteriota bacterium]
MNIDQLKLFDFLNSRLKSDLPGAKAHIKMAPFGDLERLNNNIARPDAKHSAVLLLINEQMELLFTLRSSKLRKHSGQISFPGGRSEEGETYEETALRETEEEVGIKSSNIELLGRMSGLYVPPSNNIIQPIIGRIPNKIDLVLNPDEVDEAFYVPLESFLSEEKLKTKNTVYNGKPFAYPYWDVHHSVPLWGATAIVMSEFIYIVNEFRENNS